MRYPISTFVRIFVSYQKAHISYDSHRVEIETRKIRFAVKSTMKFDNIVSQKKEKKLFQFNLKISQLSE